MEEKLINLEIHLAHLARMVDELNELVTEQQRMIGRQEREIATLKDQMKILLPSLTRTADEEEPPPHY